MLSHSQYFYIRIGQHDSLYVKEAAHGGDPTDYYHLTLNFLSVQWGVSASFIILVLQPALAILIQSLNSH